MKKPNHAGSGQIRIIGGQWRGRKLPVPESPGLRPTTDRAPLKADRGKVIAPNPLSFLSQPGTPHEIVFVDPPFRQGLLEETLRLLETQGWLADEALVYVESEVENGLPPVPANWQLYREKVAGQVAYRLYQREAQGEHHAD